MITKLCWSRTEFANSQASLGNSNRPLKSASAGDITSSWRLTSSRNRATCLQKRTSSFFIYTCARPPSPSMHETRPGISSCSPPICLRMIMYSYSQRSSQRRMKTRRGQGRRSGESGVPRRHGRRARRMMTLIVQMSQTSHRRERTMTKRKRKRRRRRRARLGHRSSSGRRQPGQVYYSMILRSY